MRKKYFLFSLVLPILFISFLAVTPAPASAGWFGGKLFAFSIGSFFSKVKSLFVDDKIPPQETSSVTQATCIPPVPSKPADLISPYGLLTVTPEVSTAGPNNIITISVRPNSDAVQSVRIYVPSAADKDDLVDWYPKNAPGVNFSQYGYTTGDGKFEWTLSYTLIDNPSKPPTYQLLTYPNYWVKIRKQHATIQQQAKNTTNADGWRKISYIIGNRSTSTHGSQGFYIGREQKPSLITTIGNDSFKRTFYSGSPPLKPFTVVPNGYFEIQTKSLGQPGIITLDVKNAKILDSAKRQVKADETITWKIQPLGIGPVRLLELSLKNACGEDYFVDPAKSATLADFDKFTFPVIYDTVVQKQTAPQLTLPAPTLKPIPIEQSKKSFSQNLTISPDRTLEGLKEGDAVTFKAMLMMSDGSTRTVNNVTWSVVGQIGSIAPNGVFKAELDPVVAEYGEGTGAVVAVYKDASGKEFIAKSPPFNVETFVPQDINPQDIDTRG